MNTEPFVYVNINNFQLQLTWTSCQSNCYFDHC